jgi:hypothetical protein
VKGSVWFLTHSLHQNHAVSLSPTPRLGRAGVGLIA